MARNAKSVEERLVNKELNEGTRQLQDDIVKDLEGLIRNAENPQGGESGAQANEDMQPSGGDKQDQKQQGKQKQSRNSKGQKKSGQKGPSQQRAGKQKGGQAPGTQQAKAGQGNKSGQDNKQPMGQGNGQNPGAGNSKDNPRDPQRDADVYKDTWGHLPETLRAQMDAYSSRQKYMDKHQELIKQYYKTIAAQGPNKGK